jgi:hypothetical protein
MVNTTPRQPVKEITMIRAGGSTLATAPDAARPKVVLYYFKFYEAVAANRNPRIVPLATLVFDNHQRTGAFANQVVKPVALSFSFHCWSPANYTYTSAVWFTDFSEKVS